MVLLYTMAFIPVHCIFMDNDGSTHLVPPHSWHTVCRIKGSFRLRWMKKKKGIAKLITMTSAADYDAVSCQKCLNGKNIHFHRMETHEPRFQCPELTKHVGGSGKEWLQLYREHRITITKDKENPAYFYGKCSCGKRPTWRVDPWDWWKPRE